MILLRGAYTYCRRFVLLLLLLLLFSRTRRYPAVIAISHSTVSCSRKSSSALRPCEIYFHGPTRGVHIITILHAPRRRVREHSNRGPLCCRLTLKSTCLAIYIICTHARTYTHANVFPTLLITHRSYSCSFEK